MKVKSGNYPPSRLPNEAAIKTFNAALIKGEILIPTGSEAKAKNKILTFHRARKEFKLFKGLSVVDYHPLDELEFKINSNPPGVIVRKKADEEFKFLAKDEHGNWIPDKFMSSEILSNAWARNERPDLTAENRARIEAEATVTELPKDKPIF